MTATPAKPTKAQGVGRKCRFCLYFPCKCPDTKLGQFDDVMGEMATPQPRVSQADRIEKAVERLQDEAKCRDRVDQALRFLDELEDRGPVSFKRLHKPLREILTGARDMKTIHSSGRKGPGFF